MSAGLFGLNFWSNCFDKLISMFVFAASLSCLRVVFVRFCFVWKRVGWSVGYAGSSHQSVMSKWVLILGGLYSFLLLYIYVILPAIK